jgi:hypothetical protein
VRGPGQNHQKKGKRMNLKTLTIAAALLAAEVGAAELPYQFKTFDVIVPGLDLEWSYVELMDINDNGEVLSVGPFTVPEVEPEYRAILSNGKRKPKNSIFSCSGITDGFSSDALIAKWTVGSSSNDRFIAGWCGSAPASNTPEGSSGPYRQFGFVYRPSTNKQILLEFPGANATYAEGISSGGKVTGSFWMPWPDLSQGCFIWEGSVKGYTRIDFPRENTDIRCFAINERRQVLGEYVTYGPEHQTVEHGHFIYDNGNFSFPFPPVLDFIGGPSTWPTDMNDDGAVVGLFHPNDGTGFYLFFYDDGVFYDIKMPEGWSMGSNLGGTNNKGEFVGTADVVVGHDPVHGLPIVETHGFVARPAPSKGPKK